MGEARLNIDDRQKSRILMKNPDVWRIEQSLVKLSKVEELLKILQSVRNSLFHNVSVQVNPPYIRKIEYN